MMIDEGSRGGAEARKRLIDALVLGAHKAAVDLHRIGLATALAAALLRASAPLREQKRPVL